MAMTERSRAALYQGLSTVVDEEAVGEMLSYFPARDVEEPASKEYIERRFAQLDARFAQIDARFAQVDARIDVLAADMKAGFAALEQRLHESTQEQLRSNLRWNVGLIVSVVGLLVAFGLFR
jgi:hypothetical protein